jgi:glycerol-3-phosphate dehydrogenase
MARTAADHGAVVANYVRAAALVKDGGRVSGVEAEDVQSEESLRIRARVVVNATGIYTDDMLWMDSPDAPRVMRWSRGTHIVLDGSLLPGGHGLLVPETADGRLIFALPWLGSTLVGTTDVPVDSPDADPEPPQEDAEFLLTELARYLPAARDAQVKSAFTGIRPLVARRPSTGSGRAGTGATAALARTHRVMVSQSGMVSITGGKWTTARLMGEHAVDRAAQVAGLERRRSRTSNLPLHGAPGGVTGVEVFRGAVSEPGYLYGTEIEAIAEMEAAAPEFGQPLAATLPYRLSQAVFAARHEMAQTVEDVLARRTRSLLLDVEAAVRAAEEVAKVMAKELGRDERWAAEQMEAVERTARSYRAPAPRQ